MAGSPARAVDALVRALAAYQEKDGLTDQALAEEIGVPRGTWSAAKTGSYNPGASFLRRVIDHSPRFAELARKALLDG